MDNSLGTSEAYARHIFEGWTDILYLSERVRTNFFYFLDNETEEEFQATNEEKEELYNYASKLVGMYSTLYPKVVERTEWKDFGIEYERFKEYHSQPWKLLDKTGTKDGFQKLSEIERMIGKALEKLKILEFEDAKG